MAGSFQSRVSAVLGIVESGWAGELDEDDPLDDAPAVEADVMVFVGTPPPPPPPPAPGMGVAERIMLSIKFCPDTAELPLTFKRR